MIAAVKMVNISFLPRLGTRQVCPFLTTPVQHRTGIPTKYNMSRKRNTRHTDWKEVKLFLDEMNVCVCKNAMDSSKNLELISGLSGITR